MLKQLFSAFRAQNPEPDLPDPDAELALGALLVRVAQSDRDYQLEEISLIDRILARQFQHSPIEAAKIRATCEKLHAAAPETDTFASLIRATTGIEMRLALTALLVRIARSDGDYAGTEIRQIDRIIGARYGLDPDEVQELRAQAETLEAEAPDMVRFTRAIKDAVAYEDRLAVVEAAWEVVLADGARASEENALMRLIASLLGVSDVDSARARRKAGA